MDPAHVSDPPLWLVPVAACHLPLLIQWRADPVTRRFNPLQPMDEAAMLARIEREGKPPSEGGTEFRWMVHQDDVAVGSVVLKQVDRHHRSAELGMGIAPEHRGRGHAARAVRLLLALAFDEVGLERIWATSHHENFASHAALLRAGLEREGLLRGHYVIDGRRVDHVVFGVLRGDWRR
jgi:ribosomal-protein-alanine N-acetyltransferase